MCAKARIRDEIPENDPVLKRQCRHSSNFRKAKATAFLMCLQCLKGLLLELLIRRAIQNARSAANYA